MNNQKGDALAENVQKLEAFKAQLDGIVTQLLKANASRTSVPADMPQNANMLLMQIQRELKQLQRVILGTDSPAGSGVQPLGIVRLISMLSSLGDFPAEVAICFATGNTARIRNLTCGTVATGRDATFVLIDKAQHSAGSTLLKSIQAGDLPGIGMVIIDGAVSAQRSRNTPPATRVPEIVKA